MQIVARTPMMQSFPQTTLKSRSGNGLEDKACEFASHVGAELTAKGIEKCATSETAKNISRNVQESAENCKVTEGVTAYAQTFGALFVCIVRNGLGLD